MFSDIPLDIRNRSAAERGFCLAAEGGCMTCFPTFHSTCFPLRAVSFRGGFWLLTEGGRVGSFPAFRMTPAELKTFGP